MTVAFWCVLAAVLAPYALSIAARWKVRGGHGGHDPRADAVALDGWRRRAYAAHLNAFEAIPGFAAGVVVARLAGVPDADAAALAMAFVAFRILHAVCYIGDRPMLRSWAFRLSLGCMVGFFVLAAVKGHLPP